ncbi:methyltransferase domain-containing protein [bacterium]|nr:methyltransferase domain-containing protein [bacterium]
MGLYSRHIAPALVDLACGARPIDRQRRKIIPQAEGVVLEIGAGGGRNLAHYDPARVTSLIALEPDPAMASRGRKRAAETRPPPPFPIEWVERGAEVADLPAGSIDTIVTTYTLCTIPDAVSALRALRPLLKPGGRLLFCEHGLAPDKDVSKWQKRIEPLWRPLAGGCHLTRDIPRLIDAGGWRIDRSETMYLPNAPRIAGWNVWGSATPA